MEMHAPAHPVPQLQGPFEESMLESVNDAADQEVHLDAVERRATLLEKPHYERVCAGRWKQKPGEKYHPLWKIAAQISFGMHLLAEGMAKSEDEVMKILQSHVDDVDGFLERTTEDFDLALSDVQERLRYLRLPLDHVEVFDRMLEDRTFRASIVDGNEKIEHIVSRTSKSIRDAMKDVQKGLDATRALGRYLDDLEPMWDRQTAEHEAVFVAMLGNVEGWGRAFMDLHLQGNRLKVILVELSETVSEMMRRAGVISRNSVRHTKVAAPVAQQMTNGNAKHYSSRKSRAENPSAKHNSSRSSTQKALPSAPDSRRASRPATEKRPREEQKTSGSTQTSGSRPKSRTSPHASSGLIPAGMTDQEDFYARPFSPGSTSSRVATTSGANTPRQQSSREKLASPRKTLTKRTQLIELPADVPKAALLQAPLSKENRRSMNLGPKSPDPADHRVSRKLSNKVLASLLKSPLSTRLSRTPQSVTSGKTNESYTTAFDSPSEHTAEYFSAADLRRTILIEEGAQIASADNGNEMVVHGLGIESQPVDTARAASRLFGASPKPQNSAFTSHPPGKRMVASPLASHPPHMEMVTSPHVKQESFPTQSASSSVKKASSPGHSRFPSLTTSSLGEPGPEIDNSEPFDLATLMQGNEHARTITASSITPGIQVDPPAIKHQPELGVASASDELEAMSATIKDVVDAGVHQDVPTPVQESPRPLVAELEGVAPVPFGPKPPTKTEKSFGPAELEAPVQHTFILPPRSSALPSPKREEGGITSATIATQSDFFKMPPPTVTQEDGSSGPQGPSANALGKQSHLSTPLNGHQTSLSPVKEDRASVPQSMLARTILRKPAKQGASRMARLQSQNILEQLSSTPPGSPIHTRSSSEMSANSAQRLSGPRISIGSNSAHPLAPSREAPPPPAPGGRPMVSPDFAATGMFEGEKKPKRGSRSSAGNQASWKKFFGGANSSPMSGTPGTPGSQSTTSYFDANAGGAEVHEQAQGMLDSAGKDVLWFKGMSRDGVWVSTASGAN